jgi:hypothetical protein
MALVCEALLEFNSKPRSAGPGDNVYIAVVTGFLKE